MSGGDWCLGDNKIRSDAYNSSGVQSRGSKSGESDKMSKTVLHNSI